MFHTCKYTFITTVLYYLESKMKRINSTLNAFVYHLVISNQIYIDFDILLDQLPFVCWTDEGEINSKIDVLLVLVFLFIIDNSTNVCHTMYNDVGYCRAAF